MKTKNVLLYFLLLFLFTVSCKKKAKKNLLTALKPEHGVEKKQPEKKPEKKQVVKPKAQTVEDKIAALQKRISYCNREYFKNMKYELIRDGYPPIEINPYDNECLPIAWKFEELFDKEFGKNINIDLYFVDFAYYADSLILMDIKLKQLGVRSKSKLVKILKQIQKDLIDYSDKLISKNRFNTYASFEDFLKKQFGEDESSVIKGLKRYILSLWNFLQNKVFEKAIKKRSVYRYSLNIYTKLFDRIFNNLSNKIKNKNIFNNFKKFNELLLRSNELFQQKYYKKQKEIKKLYGEMKKVYKSIDSIKP